MEQQGALWYVKPLGHDAQAVVEGIVIGRVFDQGFGKFSGLDQATGSKCGLRHGAQSFELEFFPASVLVAVYVPPRRQITTK